MTAALERRQVPLYVLAILLGALLGWAAPGVGTALEPAINPVLGALLFVTFLQVPVRELVGALRVGRFLVAVLVVDFVAVPLVVATMLGFLPADAGVRIGVLLVLLAPCVDYVVVFCRLAGGAADRLLAATPLLLLAQMVLLPVFLVLLLGPGVGDVVEPGPFVAAFVGLIVVPLALAWVVQRWAPRAATAASVTMVPLMVATLAVVVASQVPRLGDAAGAVVAVVPFYVLFLAVLTTVGVGVARLFRLDPATGRAVVFTGATRNSLVVLPLALALPDALAVAAVVVVTQTLVEVLGMVALVRLAPRLVPDG